MEFLPDISLLEHYCTYSYTQDYAPLNTTHNCSGNFTGCSVGACV